MHVVFESRRADLRRFGAAIGALSVVPIHTLHGDRYPAHFDNVVQTP